MSTKQTSSVIIIGSGPAGLTAAIYTARAQLNPLVIQGNMPGGQLMGTSTVENWPGEVSILGPELMQTMLEQAKKQGATFVGSEAVKIAKNGSGYTVTTKRNESYTAAAILIATGASPRRLKCPGEQEYWGKGITTCAVCDGALYKDKQVLVIGGGDSGAEDALFLTKFTQRVTLIQNHAQLTASKILTDRVLKNKAIRIIYQSTVVQFQGNGQRLSGVTIKDLGTNELNHMEVDGAFLAIGLDPNSAFCKNLVKVDQSGYVIVNEYFQTSQPGVFAAGDVHDYRYRQAISAAGDGCKAALEIERHLINTTNTA